jgi:microcin C transport system permease protein
MWRLSKTALRQWAVFRANRRGMVSLVILTVLTVASLGAELYCNSKPLLVRYKGEFYVPLLHSYPETTFGGDFPVEADYDDPFVRKRITTDGNWAIYPAIPWDYKAINTHLTGATPSPPTRVNWMGTDDRGRDVLARLIYGFRVSIFFGVVLAVIGTALGIAIGAVQGYFGGWIDLTGQRAIEIWGSLPELYLLIILSASFGPSIPRLIALLSAFGWMGLSVYVRADFLRTRNFDYVESARAAGLHPAMIMWRHILPNCLTSVITFFPFRVSESIVALTSLDFLNLGVPSPTPSLGELLREAQDNVSAWWLSISTFLVLVLTVVLINFVGEAVLEAFDPRRR